MADVKEPEEITQKGLDFGDGHSSLPSLEQPVQQPGKINVTDSRPRFWVEIPFIQSKDLYKELDLDMADAAEENTPVEIVGEIRVQTHVQYWVRHENDIVYRVGFLAIHRHGRVILTRSIHFIASLQIIQERISRAFGRLR